MLGVTDEELMAWVDGELAPPQAQRVAAAVAADAALAARVSALRALSEQLRDAFAPELDEPVPAHLAALARGKAAGEGAEVIPLAPRLWLPGWARWGGLAAGVLLAVGLGARLLSGDGAGEATVQAGPNGQLLALGPLAKALEQDLSGRAGPDGSRVLLSFRDRDGRYCRSFAAPVGRGLACREGGQRWQVVVLTAPGPALPAASADTLRLASGELPAVVIAAIEARIAGLALDADQERAARDAGWQP